MERQVPQELYLQAPLAGSVSNYQNVFRSGFRGIFWNRRHGFLSSGLPSLDGGKERRRRETDSRSLHSSIWQPTPWHLAQNTLRSTYFLKTEHFRRYLSRFANPEFLISIPAVYFKKIGILKHSLTVTQSQKFSLFKNNSPENVNFHITMEKTARK
jgi:hypothetical protein